MKPIEVKITTPDDHETIILVDGELAMEIGMYDAILQELTMAFEAFKLQKELYG